MERRQHLRHSYSCAIAGVHPSTGEPLTAGEVVDFGSGGAGVIVDRALDPLTVMRWTLDVATTPVAVPLVAQVRWVTHLAPNRFRAGLLFVA